MGMFPTKSVSEDSFIPMEAFLLLPELIPALLMYHETAVAIQDVSKDTDEPLKQLCTMVCALRLHLIAPLQLSTSTTRPLRDVKDIFAIMHVKLEEMAHTKRLAASQEQKLLIQDQRMAMQDYRMAIQEQRLADLERRILKIEQKRPHRQPQDKPERNAKY